MSRSSVPPIILCFVAYYLPGYRSGGPVRTIANMVNYLGDEFDIRIVTRDRDVFDNVTYQGINVDAWNAVGKSQVFYASKRTLTLHGFSRLMRNTPHDLLYLNSFFSPLFTALPLLARRLHLAPNPPCVIAPRGEFSPGAITLKSRTKQLYIAVARAFSLYRDTCWQASSELEAQDILREFHPRYKAIYVAPDLPAGIINRPETNISDAFIANQRIRLIFLSRVTPKKNLYFLLEILRRVKSAVLLDIYGIIDDDAYWRRCQALIRILPAHVEVAYHGVLPHHMVSAVLCKYHLFVLPTLGENYGHAIVEAMTQGTPVLISDCTPWLNLAEHGAGWDIPLNNTNRFVEVIESISSMDEGAYLALRQSTWAFSRYKLSIQSTIRANVNLFRSAMANSIAPYYYSN